MLKALLLLSMCPAKLTEEGRERVRIMIRREAVCGWSIPAPRAEFITTTRRMECRSGRDLQICRRKLRQKSHSRNIHHTQHHLPSPAPNTPPILTVAPPTRTLHTHTLTVTKSLVATEVIPRHITRHTHHITHHSITTTI